MAITRLDDLLPHLYYMTPETGLVQTGEEYISDFDTAMTHGWITDESEWSLAVIRVRRTVTDTERLAYGEWIEA